MKAQKIGILIGAIALFTWQGLASAAVFEDDFDAENGGVGVFNYAALTNWTVSNGSVDLIGAGFNDLYPGNGLYLDLDGTSFDAATLTSNAIALTVGTYELTFSLGINSVTGPGNSMLVSLGTAYSEIFTDVDAGLGSFNPIVRTIQITSATVSSLVYDHAGGDNGGLIIDNVSLRLLIPEPSSLTLLLGCCFAAGRWRHASSA